MNHESVHTHRRSSAHGHNHAHKEESFLTKLWKCLTSQRNDNPPLQYFLPGKVILYVDHSKRLNPTKLSDLIKPTIASLAAGKLKDPDPQSIITFPLGNNPGMVFSLVPVEVTSDNPDDLVDLLVDLDKNRKGKPIKISRDASIRAVSPNWLIGSATHGSSHPPSPGSWPLEAQNGDKGNFRLRDQQGKISPFATDQKAEIHVAILDTAPAGIDLEEAREKWHHKHHLVDNLLGHGDDGKMHVHTGIYTDIELMDYSVVGHRYRMPDHGLFVAGIINSIAPEATLHLIKVFTPYGAGSTETIAQGLLQVLNNREIGRPLIVNCSFGLSIDDSPDFPVELRGMSTSLQEIFATLTSQDGIVVVAAAGNYAYDDETTGQHIRPSARFPAAYDKVIGVGALPQTTNAPFIAASYSNRSGKATDPGYMAFGGEPGERQGMLGIYTSEIPVYAEGCLSFLWRKLTGKGLDGWKGPGHLPPNPQALRIDHIRYKPNTAGWAWWAGTSFATPIIAGFLAALWSGPLQGTVLNFVSARTELDKYIQNSRTPDGEKVIHVEQA